MALGTISGQLIVVGILMARFAIIKRNAGELLKFLAVFHGYFVAFFTIYGGVFSAKLKICLIVIKLFYRGESFHTVALKAVVGQCSLVEIFMAGEAFIVQAQIGALSSFLILNPKYSLLCGIRGNPPFCALLQVHSRFDCG